MPESGVGVPPLTSPDSELLSLPEGEGMVGSDGFPLEDSGVGNGFGGCGRDVLPELGELGVGNEGVVVDDCEPLVGCGIPLPEGCDVEGVPLGMGADVDGEGN